MNIVLLGTFLLLSILLMTCSSSKAENMMVNSDGPSPTRTPDSRFRSSANDPELREAREKGTYSSVLQFLIEPDALVYIGSTTIGISEISSVKDKLSSETIQDFIAANATAVQVPSSFDVYSKVKIVDLDNPVDFLREKAREGRAGVGLLRLSRVGLNDKGTEAVIYLEHHRLDREVNKQLCIVVRDPAEGVDVRCIEAGNQ